MGTTRNFINGRPLLPHEAEGMVDEIFDQIFPFHKRGEDQYKFPKKVLKAYHIPAFYPVGEPEFAPIATFCFQPQMSLPKYRSPYQSNYQSTLANAVVVDFVIPEELQDEFEKHRKRSDQKIVKNWFQSVYVQTDRKSGALAIRYGIRIKNTLEKKIEEIKGEGKWPCFLLLRQKNNGSSHFRVTEDASISKEQILEAEKKKYDIPQYYHKMVDTTYQEWSNIMDFMKSPSKANTSNWKGRPFNG